MNSILESSLTSIKQFRSSIAAELNVREDATCLDAAIQLFVLDLIHDLEDGAKNRYQNNCYIGQADELRTAANQLRSMELC